MTAAVQARRRDDSVICDWENVASLAETLEGLQLSRRRLGLEAAKNLEARHEGERQPTMDLEVGSSRSGHARIPPHQGREDVGVEEDSARAHEEARSPKKVDRSRTTASTSAMSCDVRPA